MQTTQYERRVTPDSKATLKWAQSKDRVFITVEPADLTNHKVELKSEGKLVYRYGGSSRKR